MTRAKSATWTPLPLPADPRSYAHWARDMSTHAPTPKALMARHLRLRPAERIAALFPIGATAGILMGFVAAAKSGRPLPEGVGRPTGPRAESWARGAAAALSVPPKAAFDLDPYKQCRAIYHAGLERGLLLALEALPSGPVRRSRP